MDTPYEEPPGASQWSFRTISHARIVRPPTEYIVDKYLASHTLNILYGAPGSLKSMIALSLSPVSYTHLDVYKRQGRKHPARGCPASCRSSSRAIG